MPEQGKSKKGRCCGRQFRNTTHKRYNARHGYVSKSNPRWQNKKKVPAAVRARIRSGLTAKAASAEWSLMGQLQAEEKRS